MSREEPIASRKYADPLAVKLAIGVTLLVAFALVPAVYMVAKQHHRASLDAKRSRARGQGNLIRIALEHQMLENDRTLITRMVEGYSSSPEVERVVILDREGKVRFTNDPKLSDREFSRDSPTCQVCHRKAPGQRLDSALIEMGGGEILRSVLPLRNRKACHQCHDPSQSINGVLIADTNVIGLSRRLEADLRNLVIGVGLLALVLLAGLGFIVNRLILRRLGRLTSTARAIRAGDFSKRVDVGGDDALTHLGDEFNAMTESITGLLTDLHDQRTQLENVMNSVDDGLLVVDATLTIIAVNQSLARRVGADREELIYRRCCDVWGEGSDCCSENSGNNCPTRRCFATGDLHKSVVIRQTSEGEVRQEEVFASPIFGVDGKVERVVEVWRDITERKIQEAQMAEFHRLASLGMLASGFSHEVNTPLGTMLLCADDVKRNLRGDGSRADLAGIEKQIDLIRTEILRCRDLTTQFLQMSRGHSLRRDILQIPEIIRSTVPLVMHVAGEAGVDVQVLGGQEGPLVSVNAGAVRQVVLNILLNAVQASQPGQQVRVSWHDGPMPLIRIEDQGRGMTEETQKKIFEPFFSANSKGTGLGLFVSLSLARQWGGYINVYSELGKGSWFEITFPDAGVK